MKTEKDFLKEESTKNKHFRFADWVNGRHVDETFKAVDRADAIKIMNDKYPNHIFALIQELS